MDNAAILDIAMEIIAEFEGYSSKVYICPGGRSTIGYGHAIKKDEQHFTEINKEQAKALLKEDCLDFLGSIQKALTVDLNNNQLAAILSLCYNIGIGAFQKSTLRRRLNAGEGANAANEFLRWNKVNGQPMAGLTRRREAEKALFLR